MHSPTFYPNCDSLRIVLNRNSSSPQVYLTQIPSRFLAKVLIVIQVMSLQYQFRQKRVKAHLSIVSSSIKERLKVSSSLCIPLHIPPRTHDALLLIEQLSHNKGHHLSTVVGQELNHGLFSLIAGLHLRPYNILSQVTRCARATMSITWVTSDMETLCAAPRRCCLISSPQCTLPSTNKHVFDTKVHASPFFQLTVSTPSLSFARVECARA